MLDWLKAMTPAELSKQGATYVTLAAGARLTSTREAFDRLAKKCAALAAEKTNHAARQLRNGSGSSPHALSSPLSRNSRIPMRNAASWPSHGTSVLTQGPKRDGSEAPVGSSLTTHTIGFLVEVKT